MSNFPFLTFVPVDSLLIHEQHDHSRTQPLLRRIKSSGLWRNPPVVSPLQDGSGRYMVLDGANRSTVLQELGYPHALVQVVQPDDPGLKLRCWNHVVWELKPSRFLENLRRLEGLNLNPAPGDDGQPSLFDDCGLAVVQLPGGERYKACSTIKELKERVRLLNAIVGCYVKQARLDRTNEREVENLVDIYPSLSGLVVFPTFDIHQLLRLAADGRLLPTGITRFMISPRALHLNYPLDELAADKPIDLKNEHLNRWVQERLARKGVRYYAEPTYLFDE
jgi:L-serine kinase (ATP) / ParB family transcriptional regulator, heme-responsive regulator